ncbi:SLC8A [Mytilus coruscus]|uniref:SLC8A n=1 Tax=Mytilus coruscus TaxID=42192 RepID=A0A6J8DZN7_MYTCO|nr:SLC8A [Mytilus coruscus]
MSYSVYSYYSRGHVLENVENGTEQCASWLLLPAENLWNVGIRAFIYILAILYLFLGVAISSDIFMGSIETITSKKRTIVTWDAEKEEKHEREVLVWNETVANLTLMALGSSAPEILLATIEMIFTLGDTEPADSLGTFTIIGSASFNLFVISSICVVSVSSPNVKYIKEFGVFIVTTIWSVWAYVWMLLVVQYISPGVIEPWEAWVTLLYMPMFVLNAYAQDCGWWCKKCKKTKVDMEEEEENDNILKKTSTDIFKLYVDTFMKYKQEASGCKCDPKYCKPDCENDKECKTKIQYIIDNAAYNLDIDKVKHNSGLRFIAKICLNNLWGHFEHITKIVFNEKYKDISTMILDENIVLTEYKEKEEYSKPNPSVNVYIALFTTAHARLKLYELLDILQERVLYMDTDSCIYNDDGSEACKKVENMMGSKLGDLTDEIVSKHNANHIKQFISAGPKDYSMKLDTEKLVSCCKGFRLNAEVEEKRLH